MRTILIVDDREIDRQVISNILKARGHTVLEGTSGAEALELVRQHRPALVITDVLMPGISGLQLVELLRADPALAPVPILFYTALYDEYNTERAIRASGYAVLARPVTPDEVAQHVEAALRASPAAGRAEARGASPRAS
jgi:CheY-like chemotaxis protein